MLAQMSIWLWLALTLPPQLVDARVAVSGSLALGENEVGELSLTILDAPEQSLPLLVWLDASAAVDLRENRLTWADVVDRAAAQPRVVARLVAREAGTHEVRGWVTYVTCDAKRCRPRRANVAWTVRVRGEGRGFFEGPLAVPAPR